MKIEQQTLSMARDRGFEQYRKPTRRDEFLQTMDRIMPWAASCALTEPHLLKNGNGRPLIGLERMLRIHFLQHWSNRTGFAWEGFSTKTPASLLHFACIGLGRREPMPDATNLLRFRHMLVQYKQEDKLFAAVGRGQ